LDALKKKSGTKKKWEDMTEEERQETQKTWDKFMAEAGVKKLPDPKK